MKYYLIIVEGAHDLATIERILKMQGIDKPIRQKEELATVWKRLIPDKYPFHGDALDRITPVPSFWRNEEISVAIQCAGSDTALLTCLKEVCNILKLGEKLQLNKVMLVCDADRGSAEAKKSYLLRKCERTADFDLQKIENNYILQLEALNEKERIRIPLIWYVFPDDMNSGILENVLLQAADKIYPRLKEGAEGYIDLIDKNVYATMNDEAKRNKATVGCIANILKPGKANQVAIADGEWISNQSRECEYVERLFNAIEMFVQGD